jgi:hypothetical protein
MTIAGSGLFYPAEQELPSVGFGAVNEDYSQSYGVVDQGAEAGRLRLEASLINGDTASNWL